uniref:Uncharacterized protein n=1 Tax=Romanomermis culicivorax TaxID=13658 RepID=A0A915IZ70_ROMCU
MRRSFVETNAIVVNGKRPKIDELSVLRIKYNPLCSQRIQYRSKPISCRAKIGRLLPQELYIGCPRNKRSTIPTDLRRNIKSKYSFFVQASLSQNPGAAFSDQSKYGRVCAVDFATSNR